MPGHFDVDLVLYSQSKLLHTYMIMLDWGMCAYIPESELAGITIEDMLSERKGCEWIRKLNEYLQMNVHGYKLDGINRHTVTFKVRSGGKEVSFDLLISPLWKQKEQLLQYLSRKPWSTVRMYETSDNVLKILQLVMYYITFVHQLLAISVKVAG